LQSIAKVVITRADAETNKDYLTMSIVVNNKTDGTFVDMSVDMHKDLNGKILVSLKNVIQKHLNLTKNISDEF
jgi:hypothetical protein